MERGLTMKITIQEISAQEVGAHVGPFDAVRVTTIDGEEGESYTIHRDDADPEHRLFEYRIAAAYFARRSRRQVELERVVHEWAEQYGGMWDMADGFHESINLSEAEALANLLLAAGQANLAAILLQEWKYNDEDWQEREEEYNAALAAVKVHPSYDPNDRRGDRE